MTALIEGTSFADESVQRCPFPFIKQSSRARRIAGARYHL